MWYTWTALLVVSCALVQGAEVGAGSVAVATTRAPPRTLDRQAAELAWRTWLQSPESGNQNAPPRRITTKSLFITPLVCPKGQRLDRNGCVQVVTVNQDEHERILLEQLNALFTSAPSGDVLYDYGDEEPGPLQLSIPIGLDPQAAPLKAEEPLAQAQESQPNYVNIDKKDENKPNADASIEAELELLKLQHSHHLPNDTTFPNETDILSHNVLNNFLPLPDKPKRDSAVANETETALNKTTEEGQKELVYGHVNVDPVIYNTEYQNQPINTMPISTNSESKKPSESPPIPNNATIVINNSTTEENKNTLALDSVKQNGTIVSNSTLHVLKKDGEMSKLNPESDYSDIGEAIKLISRYAEVTTDDNFSKDQKKYAVKDDSILGTRTKLQHRRNRPKPSETKEPLSLQSASEADSKNKPAAYSLYPKNEAYYRYPWQSQHSPTPPPDYPFRHVQDYWPGRNQIGGLYNTMHENPRRHHHSYPHNYFRPHEFPNAYIGYPGPYPGLQEAYPGQLHGYPQRVAQHRGNPMRSHNNNQDLYSLLGLRHWFSSEGTSKR